MYQSTIRTGTGLRKWLILVASVVTLAALQPVSAAEKQLELGEGTIVMPLPDSWKQVAPRSRIIEYEFMAPADAKQDDATARITIMRAGGSIRANIERWYSQFTQPDGSSTKERAKVEEFKVADMPVHWVEISGTFKESMGGGPFAPGRTVERPGYKMIGVILETNNQGTYFFKVTGPEKTVDSLSEEFKRSLKAIEVNP
ncbi:MAG: hypothetical protein KatS3mg111_3979 [Pirellulaceae bacterium]|nr:MAG: hypothetical protein KatS3mg111_3979 [Pirellulaceae bacterium]